MSRINTLLSVAFVSMISATSLTAFASSGFTPAATEVGGASHAMPVTQTRAQVESELQAARASGSLAKISSEAGYAPEFENTTQGGLTREAVLQELRRAQEDGSMRRINSNRGY